MGMKATADDNELVFRIRIAPHTSMATDLKSVEDQVLKMQKRMTDGSMRIGKANLMAFGIPDERELAKAASMQLRHQQKMADANKKAIDAEQQRVKKAADEKTAIAAKQAADKAKVDQKAANDKAKLDKKAADDAIREAKREAAEIDREEERLHQRHRQRQLNRARTNRTSREEAASDFTGLDSLRRNTRGLPGSGGMGGGSFSFGHRAGAINNLVGGATNLARGVAYGGMVGEQDSQKILSTLLKIEGGIALIHGGLSLGKGLSAMGAGGALSAAAPVAAFVAAVAGAAAAINGIKRQITGEAMHNDSYEMKIGRATASLGAYGYRAGRSLGITSKNTNGLVDDGVFSNARGLVESEDRLASQQRMINDPSRARARAIADLEFQSSSQQYDIHDQTQTEMFKAHAGTYGNDQQRRRAYNQMQLNADTTSVGQAQGQLSMTSDEGQREVLAQRIVELEKRRTEIIRDDLQLEREIGKTKIDTSQETIANLKQQRDIQIGMYKDAEDKLKSAAERFADMGTDEKSRLFRLKGQLDQAKNNPFNAERIRASFTKEDRQLLNNSGLGDLQEGARQSALEKARREGFGALAGGGAEERQAQQASETAMKIETKLNVERKYVISLEREDSRLVESLASVIEQQLNVRDAAMRQELANKLGAGLTTLSRQSDSKIVELNAARK